MTMDPPLSLTDALLPTSTPTSTKTMDLPSLSRTLYLTKSTSTPTSMMTSTKTMTTIGVRFRFNLCDWYSICAPFVFDCLTSIRFVFNLCSFVAICVRFGLDSVRLSAPFVRFVLDLCDLCDGSRFRFDLYSICAPFVFDMCDLCPIFARLCDW
ncbi:hypothetical protein Acr_24g0000340 [Actinidia rufa]|uniref:Uncharacterized protein n=1 Tax=Actinidia rufa TaxID=165716 RepID=A0A7J0GTA9_9ERIC|nr:hypothetical protein Acr_24g0000340 [Actinidia rufa]